MPSLKTLNSVFAGKNVTRTAKRKVDGTNFTFRLPEGATPDGFTLEAFARAAEKYGLERSARSGKSDGATLTDTKSELKGPEAFRAVLALGDSVSDPAEEPAPGDGSDKTLAWAYENAEHNAHARKLVEEHEKAGGTMDGEPGRRKPAGAK